MPQVSRTDRCSKLCQVHSIPTSKDLTGMPASSRIAAYAADGANTAISTMWSWPRNSIFISPDKGSHNLAVYPIVTFVSSDIVYMLT